MNNHQTIVGTLVFGAIIAAFTATPVAAQTCGDANDDNKVSVTDGVQALRSAAGLSSSCEDGCDVDGNGAVTVTDGVNILRKAAGLVLNEACDFTGQEANGVVNPSFGVFDGITKVPGFASANAVTAAGPDCENTDGTVEVIRDIATFSNCKIAGTIIDGVISRVVLGSGIALGFQDYRIVRIKSGRSLTFNGQLISTEERAGKRTNGKLTVDSSERGMFTMELVRILITGDGSVRQGSLIFDFASAKGGKIARVRIEFDDGDELPTSVLLRNKQVKQFLLNRSTRTLHPQL